MDKTNTEHSHRFDSYDHSRRCFVCIVCGETLDDNTLSHVNPNTAKTYANGIGISRKTVVA